MVKVAGSGRKGDDAGGTAGFFVVLLAFLVDASFSGVRGGDSMSSSETSSSLMWSFPRSCCQ
jgi:hypothetical protein